MLGPQTNLSFTFERKKPTDSDIILAGATQVLVNKDFENGKRKLVNAGGTQPGTLRYVTLTISKNAKSIEALQKDFMDGFVPKVNKKNKEAVRSP
jgi:hypothetical protein